ncbi:hypothetical protein R6Z07M_019047 [Ovis aries]
MGRGRCAAQPPALSATLSCRRLARGRGSLARQKPEEMKGSGNGGGGGKGGAPGRAPSLAFASWGLSLPLASKPPSRAQPPSPGPAAPAAAATGNRPEQRTKRRAPRLESTEAGEHRAGLLARPRCRPRGSSEPACVWLSRRPRFPPARRAGPVKGSPGSSAHQPPRPRHPKTSLVPAPSQLQEAPLGVQWPQPSLFALLVSAPSLVPSVTFFVSLSLSLPLSSFLPSLRPLTQNTGFLLAQLVKNPPAMRKTWGSIPGLGRSPGEGKGYPLHYSGLENSIDCIVHGVAKSRTQLSNLKLPKTHMI